MAVCKKLTPIYLETGLKIQVFTNQFYVIFTVHGTTGLVISACA